MKFSKFVLVPVVLGIAVIGGCGVTREAREASPSGTAKPTAVTADNGTKAVPAASAAPARALGAPAGAGAPAQATAGNQAQIGGALPPIPPVNPMVIKNANLSISVDDPEATTSQVDQVVKAAQGTIISQTVRSQDEKTFVNVTIRVPADNFEETLAKLRDLRAHGTRVLNDTVSAQDVTEQFVDLEAQYRNLQTTRDAYQRLLDKATAVSDIVTLTREVASIQTQMDQIKGRQNVLTRQSRDSTITLSISPVGAGPQATPRPLPKPVQAAQQAWQALLIGLQGFAVVLIWMAILLPVPTLVLVGGWLVYRRLTARPASV
jgi:hypothetical protein